MKITAEEGSCFFCFKPKATLAFSLKPPYKWPAPMPEDMVLAMCQDCDRLTSSEKAAIISDHVNNLRIAHNNKVIAQRN